MNTHKRLAALAAITALIGGGVAVAPAQAAVLSTHSAAVASVQAMPNDAASTTLWIHGKAAHVWKSWERFNKGGYKGHFGAYSVAKGVNVFAQIDWNSGRRDIVLVKPHSTHVYYGAKSVYLTACTWYDNAVRCSGLW